MDGIFFFGGGGIYQLNITGCFTVCPAPNEVQYGGLVLLVLQKQHNCLTSQQSFTVPLKNWLRVVCS